MRRGYLKAGGRRAASCARALRMSAAIAPLMLLATALPMARAQAPADEVDTALIVSVDVSNSVDDARYKLQMEGIARALEDPSVIQAIIGGAKGGILFSMITWADQAKVNLPWTHITNAEEAKAAAMRVRALPRQGGEFTCMSRMMRFVSDKIVPQIPAKAAKVVLDVSGDGRDNCNEPEPVEKVRDELVSYGVTVNGLPILEGNEGEGEGPGGVPTQSYLPAAPGDSTGTPLEDWYRDHVKGGPGSFVLPANGYADFGRAIRQKFVLEVSSLFGDAR
jgi:Protein of unknown function (DUF1194)